MAGTVAAQALAALWAIHRTAEVVVPAASVDWADLAPDSSTSGNYRVLPGDGGTGGSGGNGLTSGGYGGTGGGGGAGRIWRAGRLAE